MRVPDAERHLLAALEEMEIIDCHEHLPPEADRLSWQVDVFTLFSHYTAPDFIVAGMRQADYERTQDATLPLDYRWRLFEPYWRQVRWNSYARAALITAKRFYGFDDINAETYQPLSDAIRKQNTPGLYQRVLGDACRIRTSLTQCGRTDTGTSLLTPLLHMTPDMSSWRAIQGCGYCQGQTMHTLDDFLDACRAAFTKGQAEGCVGLKMMSNPYGNPDRAAAVTAFDNLREGRPADHDALRSYYVDQMVGFAGELGLVVAVHTGYWGDFRTLAPTHMIPLLQRHPRTRFDMYHLGYPYVRESLMIGKAFPNTWLNLAWTHIISQRFAVESLDEAIDLVPMNKILGFGGDYGKPVEKVIGHLAMAKEDIAQVLARRVAAGRWTEKQALAIARQWLWDNPVELYRLRV